MHYTIKIWPEQILKELDISTKNSEEVVEDLFEKDQVLLDYLNQQIGHIAEQLVLAGVISEVPAALPVFVNPLAESWF